MRVPVKLLGFVFWLFSFHFAQSQDCLREDIKYKDLELVEKPSYKNGEMVKVNCMTGFTGMYRLQCEQGKWKANLARPCTKKKCSNPGDTPNGEFKLLEGSEFVFGATVVYTCNKGFEMTSRINRRTCRSQGWDNTLPVCEAVKCPHIHTAEGVTAMGKTEEGHYGDVIHFECVSSEKMLDGRSDINCTETGEWSGSVPTCKDITCTAPDIPNGIIDDQTQEYQYKKDAILQYRCLQGFKRREGNPICTKFGWTLNPECNEVTCELKSPTFGVKRIEPAGKTFFRAGERVKITCDERYMIFLMKETVKSFTCQKNGEWDHQPLCEEIRCEVPRDPNVRSPHTYFTGDMKLGARKYYYCWSGYQGEATCTEDGWKPNPLCGVKMCEAPNIQNAEIMGDQRPKYDINSAIWYKCNIGFEPEQPVKITCNSQTEWTGIQKCTAKQKPCPDLSVENGLIYSRSSTEEKTFYSCNEGYKTFTGNWWDSVTCSEGSWSEEPLCILEEECGAFPSVHHGKLSQSKQTFRDGQSTLFECDPGFKSTYIKCVRGTWETPVCEVDVQCKNPPKVENAFITSKPEEFYVDGSSVTYICQRSSTMTGKSKVFCRNGLWDNTPECKVSEFRCEVPRDQTVRRPDLYFKGDLTFGKKTTYYCERGYYKLAEEATCTRDGWTPNPLCVAVSEFRCEVPRDRTVHNPNSYFIGDMNLGARIFYYCVYGYYKMAEEATCTLGGWTPNPLCVQNA